MPLGDARTQIMDKDVLIAVMGLTGSGKSTLINLACQSQTKLRVGHDLWSCTDIVEAGPPFELDGRQVWLFDTPGFDDTNKSQAEILRIIAIELEKQFRQGITLRGIIYVCKISDIRVGGLAEDNFRIFRKLCGDKSLKNVVIVTNMWSKVTEEEGIRRVAQLISLDDFFKPALEKKARIMHHRCDTVESIHGIIRAIMENHPAPLLIQEELVNEGKDINQTAAGQEVDEKIAALTMEYEKKIQEQIAAAEEARRLHDEETRKEQLEEKAKNEEKLSQLREESARHAERYRTLQADFEASRTRVIADAKKLRFECLEVAMKAQQISAPRPRQVQRRPATLNSITSGMVHVMWNIRYGFYATMDRDKKYIIARENFDSPRQQWVFKEVNSHWTITNVSSGLYMSLDRGDLVGRNTVQYWNIKVINGHMHTFQLSVVHLNGYALGLEEGDNGEKIGNYEKQDTITHAQTWGIAKK